MKDRDGHYNPGLDRLRGKQSKSNGHVHAPKQERDLAKSLANKPSRKVWAVPGSGSGKQKGDVRAVGIARIECKTTSNKSFSVTREMIDKIENAAGATNEIPVIQIDLLDSDGRPAHRCAVVPLYVLDRLLEVR